MSPVKRTILTIGLTILAFFIVMGVIGSITLKNQNQKGQTYFNSNSNNGIPITGITQFVIINDNGLYKVRFSLNDQNDALVSSDARIHFTICCNYNASDYPTKAYETAFNITADQFHDVTLVLTGTTLLAYSWQINSNEVYGNPSGAKIEVSLPNGKQLVASTDILD